MGVARRLAVAGAAAVALVGIAACGSVGESGNGGGGKENGSGSKGGAVAKELNGEIIGIEPSAGLTKAAKQALKDYELGDLYKLKTSSTPAMLTELQSQYDQKKPIIVTLWRPHWIYSKLKLRDLEDPKKVLGDAEQVSIVARKGFAKENPTVASWFKNFKMNDEQLGSLEQLALDKYKKDKDGVQKGVAEWIKANPDYVAGLTKGSAGADKSKTVTVASIAWDEDTVANELWKQVLAKKGYTLEVKPPLEAGPIYQAVSDGKVDAFFDGWFPKTHESYWKEYGPKLEKVGTWYTNAKLTLAVPEYVKDVKSIEDLTK